MASGDTASKLTRQLLKSLSNEFDVESIHTLDLTKRDLNDISALCMERLNLSYNDITRLHPLSTMSQLQVLDLSANRITALDSLNNLDKLVKLNLAGNLIGSISTLRPIISLESLRHLRLQDTVNGISNPICMRSSYKEEITTAFPKLISLDGEIIRGQDSEVFRLLAELDQQVSQGSPRAGGGPTKTTPPPPKIPEDIFTISWDADSHNSDMVDQQFRSSLDDCQGLSAKGSQLIREAEEKLRRHERV